MISLSFKRFTRLFAVELWPWYLGGMIFLAVTNIISLEIPQLAKEVVNALQHGIGDDDGHLARVALAIVALGLTQIIVRSLSRILIFWPGRKLEATSKSYLFARALELPQTFYDRFGMGDLISRLSNDLGQLRIFYAFAILQVVNLVFISVFTLYKMLSVHEQLTVAALSPILIMLVITRYVMPQMQKFTKKNQEAIGTLTNRVTESFTNIHVIQSNAAERSFHRLIEAENQKVFETDMKVLVLRTLFFPLISSMTGLAQLIVLFLGGTLVVRGELSVGDILAFNIYLSYMAFPLTSIGIIIAIYQRSKTALERLEPLFVEPQEGPREASARPQPAAPILKVQHLSFQYPDSQHLALKDVNFQVQAGEMVGICGPVGAGKSTLFQILTRIYNPPDGTVFYRGQDINQLPPAELRREIGYGLQRVHLFSASIRENLSVGMDPKPSPEELQAAARAAQIDREIAAFVEGWETQIGEKGIRLSGGQKQRLALARLFLRKAPVLLLDDVLSAVDNITEARLIQELRKRGGTMLICSHRSSVLHLCHRVLLLKDGQLLDTGSFQELMRRHPELQEEIHDEPNPESV
ncbi:ABC transporter ATP-binding protein [Oligoflexus tunisiensis]|uniref:ABC transporter ATP-binding protein n=1 Tax=Oligoflexus tunisiensis TaxID=708132 RepID=UPI00114C9829|nr:ABC transporter ATP-binding protein [Oligoflexus tunisiensis]